MKTTFLSLFLLCAAAFTGCRHSQQSIPSAVYQFDLDRIAAKTALSHKWVDCGEPGTKALSVTVSEQNNELILTPDSEGINWGAANYLVCEVQHSSPFSVPMRLQFFRKTGGEATALRQGEEATGTESWLSCTIGILPQLKTKMVFPLSHLDGQEIFLSRQPRQLKGTASGRRIDPTDVGKVSIVITPSMAPDYLANLQITAIYLSSELPKPYAKPDVAVVDSFGQWTGRDWPGKVHSFDELKSLILKTETEAKAAALPNEWSAYGGWKQLRFQSKGFFYTHHDGMRWWLVDPEGYAFISAGIDCIRSQIDGVYSGQEDLFEWVPSKDDAVFAEAYGASQRIETIDFLRCNLMRVYGAAWKEKWMEITAGLIKKWRVNTVANWSENNVATENNIPYVLNMSRFPQTEVKLYRDFPDVFDPVYRQESERFAQQLEPIKNDRCLIGYFLQNEPHWAFGDNNLAFEMFAVATPSFTKREMVRWLEKKYGNIAAFNAAWKQNLSGFDALEKLTMKDRPSDAAWDDCTEFSGIMVDCYVETVCSEVKKVDPNHLNLGMRYAWISSDLCYRAGAWFDVFSVNGYTNPDPPATEEIARRSGKPVMIGEWHFGCAVDRGLPATGIQGAESQAARGEAYRYYFEQGIARPELIGVHWFQWNDQPIYGRFDGENYNIGFVDICMQPYKELSEQATLSHERMYRVASGQEAPYNKTIRKVPQIYY